MNNFQKLQVYQRSNKLFPCVYKMVRSWKFIDQKELGSQIIRSANSIHANVTEGYNKSKKEFRHYISNSIGSCDELISHLRDAFNVGLIDKSEYEHLVNEYIIVGKQLTRLKQNL